MNKNLELWIVKEDKKFKIDSRQLEILSNRSYNIEEYEIKIQTQNLPKFCWVRGLFEINEEENTLSLQNDVLEIIDAAKDILTHKVCVEVLKSVKVEELNTQKNIYKIPNDLFIEEKKWDLINSSINHNQYPLLIGPKGSGKTSTAYALAHARGYDFYRLNCGTLSKPKQTIVGTMQSKDGSTFLVESEFLKFYTSSKNTIIMLDELSRIPGAASNYMMTMLEGFDSYIYVDELGKKFHKGKNVTFCAAANFGFEYGDTRNLDGALQDRFQPFIIDYLSEEKEIECIIQMSNCKLNIAKVLVKIGNVIRKNEETLRVGISTRKLISLAQLSNDGWSIKDIIDNVLINIFYNGSFDNRTEAKKIISSII